MRVLVPPIKCQGIKTKLVPLILRMIERNHESLWVEPFLGSGVVALNVAPARALLADANPHVVRFYKAIQDGSIDGPTTRAFLQREGYFLSEKGKAYYYEVRERFNSTHEPLDFLFLNRSCFNGVIRFNKSGGFNVPFGHKPQRFAPAYVTKIVNQIERFRNSAREGRRLRVLRSSLCGKTCQLLRQLERRSRSASPRLAQINRDAVPSVHMA